MLAADEGIGFAHDEMRKSGLDLDFKSKYFSYNSFQAYLAAKILADQSDITVAQLPTGSGKSFIASMLAHYFIRMGKRVCIVTSE